MVCQYRIAIRGRVAPHLLDLYEDEFCVTRADGVTTLSGPIRDPAQLHGMISHLTAVGLELVEVRQGLEVETG